MGRPFSSVLSSTRFLHDGHHADDIRGRDWIEPPGAAVLVPVPLSTGGFAQPDLAVWSVQAPGQPGVQPMHGLPKGLPHGGDR